MKTRFDNTLAKPATAIALAVAGLLAGGAAQAAGTASGVAITNLATLDYSVGTVPQTPIGSSAGGNTSGAGTPTSFTVDNKVNLTLVENNTLVTSVTPGSVGQVTTFTLSNTGNTAQGYTFAAANATGAVIAGTADSIDVTSLNVYVETNGASGYQAGADTLTAVASLLPNASIVVYVVADVPIAATDTQQANITLTATTTTENTTTAVLVTAGANTAGVDIVLADDATTELEFVGGSAASDGQATARDAYKVSTSALSVAKTVAPLCDPINGPMNAKNIPGSFVRYTITISNSNTATASALLTTITDDLTGKPVTLDPNLISGLSAAACVPAGAVTSAAGSGFVVSVTGSTRASYATPMYFTTISDADGVEFAGSIVTANFATLLPAVGMTYVASELKKGESVSLSFNVQID